MKYFTMKELTKSSTADKLGIDNTPTPEASVALSNLVTHVLDPLREMYGKAITVVPNSMPPWVVRKTAST